MNNFFKSTIENGKQLEKPTAKCYYTQLQESNSIFKDISVEQIKNKSNNLKKSYQEAMRFLNGTGQGVGVPAEENDEDGTTNTTSLRNEVLKRCRYFDELSEIYANKANVVTPVIFDSVREMVGLSSYVVNNPELLEIDGEIIDESGNVLIDELRDEPEQDSIGETSNASAQLLTHKAKPIPLRRKQNYTNNAINKLEKMEDHRQEVMEKRLKLDEEKFVSQMQLEREKFTFEKSKHQEEMRLRLEIRKMELEKEERIALKELELKYKQI